MPHDVFISYAHADNKPPWVSVLKEVLQGRLHQLLGRAPDIWMDPSLEPNHSVRETIPAHVADSSTLVLVMTPAYLNSGWCGPELDAFLAAHGADKPLDRVFIVGAESVERSRWDERLRDLSAVPFGRLDDKGVWRRHGGAHPNPEDREHREFWDAAVELAHFLAKQLEVVGVPATRAVERRTVWVAEVPYDDADLIRHRDNLVRAMRQADANVVPNGEGYPKDSVARLSSAIAFDLAQAKLRVQLLGASTGPAIPSGANEPAVTIASLQHKLATRDPRQPLHAWRSSDLDLESIADPAWRDRLRSITASSIEDFRARVLAAYAGEAPAAPAEPPSAPNGSLTICVSATAADSALRDRVCDVLQDLDVTVLVLEEPKADAAAEANRKDLETRIGQSHGAVIVYGDAKPSWASGAYMMIKKILAKRDGWMLAALVDGPPPGKPGHGIHARKEMMAIDCRDSPPSASLFAPYLDALRARLAGGASGA